MPTGAKVSAHAPSKALEHLPESPGLSETPLVLKRYWAVDSSATAVFAWLKSNAPTGLRLDGSGFTGGPGTAAQHFVSYRAASLPRGIAVGDLYFAVVPTGPNSSAIGAYALTLAQPPRPAAENVPANLSSAVIGWSLAPGGTPARKELTGAAARKLARDFNALKVDTAGVRHCPMIPMVGGDVVVTFTADGHTWKVDVPACPDIGVTRDGVKLPPLAFAPGFLNDLKTYAGHLPQAGPPRGGGVIPLVQPPMPR